MACLFEQAIHTGVGRVRDYDPGSGPAAQKIRAMANLISNTVLHERQLSEGSWLRAPGSGLQTLSWPTFCVRGQASLTIILTSPV